MKKAIKAGLCLVLCMGLLTGCATYNNFKNAFFGSEKTNTTTEELSTVKIGVFEPLSGENKDKGNLEVMGIQLAHELYPEVLGKPVELIMADNQSDMYAAETAIQELVAQKPSVVLGSYGETLTLIAGDAVKANNIPAISITSTNPLITVNNQYYFCATYADERQGAALADFIYKNLRLSRTATVKMYGDDTATASIKRFNDRMKAVSEGQSYQVGSYNLSSDSSDYTGILEQLKAENVQAIFLDTPVSVAQEFMKQAEAIEMTDVLFLGPNTWNDEKFIQKIQSDKKFNVAFTADFMSTNATTDMSETFIKAYKLKYGDSAEPAQETAIAFDAYLMALEAITNAYNTTSAENIKEVVEAAPTEAEGRALKEEYELAMATGIPQGKPIRDALMNLKDFEGASGFISYGGTNEATKNIEITYYRKGILIKNNGDTIGNAVQKEVTDKVQAQQAEKAAADKAEADDKKADDKKAE